MTFDISGPMRRARTISKAKLGGRGRVGLVPKKVTVTKRGRTFQQTVYVRPEERREKLPSKPSPEIPAPRKEPSREPKVPDTYRDVKLTDEMKRLVVSAVTAWNEAATLHKQEMLLIKKGDMTGADALEKKKKAAYKQVEKHGTALRMKFIDIGKGPLANLLMSDVFYTTYPEHNA